MADSSIGLQEPGSPTKRLDTEQLSVASVTVERERLQVAGATAAEIARVLNTDPGGGDYALVVRDAAPVSIQTARAASTATAAGASDDLNGTQIGSGKTGKLMQLVVSSSVAFRADLKTVSNGVASAALLTLFGGPFHPVDFRPVTKEAFKVAHDAGAGLDAFRVTVTNLDTSEAADLFGTMIWDEV